MCSEDGNLYNCRLGKQVPSVIIQNGEQTQQKFKKVISDTPNPFPGIISPQEISPLSLPNTSLQN